jgi:ABC-type transporter Mla subunit MlaD
VSSDSVTSPRPLTRAEQEVHSASERLNEQVDEALAAVASLHDPDGVGELDARAARLERAARDLAVALRELAEERKSRESE